MEQDRPLVISIAGFDPTAGAGLLADIKCFEQHKVYGFGICAALTIQTDSQFYSMDWMDANQIIAQIVPLRKKFNIVACKIGLIKDLNVLEETLFFLKSAWPEIRIVVDPILKATAGHQFQKSKSYAKGFFKLLPLIDIITPNYLEMKDMGGSKGIEATAARWSAHCAVLLKGGHNDFAIGTDYLYINGSIDQLDPIATHISNKHGSGCVLSASITAYLAFGYDLPQACLLAKRYTERFLNSNITLLGFHYED